jgi:hypothetical protein
MPSRVYKGEIFTGTSLRETEKTELITLDEATGGFYGPLSTVP